MSNAAPPIDDFEVWLQGLLQPTALIELAVILAIIALSWGMSWGLRRALSMQDEKSSVLFGRRIIDGALFPLLLLVLAYVARALLVKLLPVAVFKVAHGERTHAPAPVVTSAAPSATRRSPSVSSPAGRVAMPAPKRATQPAAVGLTRPAPTQAPVIAPVKAPAKAPAPALAGGGDGDWETF